MHSDQLYILYSKENCPFCVRAENLLKSRGLAYVKKMLDVDFTKEQLVDEIMIVQQKTFPYIIKETQEGYVNVGGCDELVKSLMR